MSDYRKDAIVGSLLWGLAVSTPIQAQFYFENFDAIRGFEIADAGFTGRFWKLGTDRENRFRVSVSPEQFGKSSKATSPSLSFRTDELLKLKGGFTVQYELQFPGTWEVEPPEPSKPAKTSVDLLDPEGHRLLTLVFRPNPPADIDNINLILIDHHTRERRSAKTETVTPFGTGSQAGTVNLKIAFRPTPSGDSTIEVFYGENGESRDTPLIVHEFQGSMRVNRLTFRHRPGTGRQDDSSRVDDISVRSNDLILFPTHPDNRFDRELLTSDGTNTQEAFDAESYHQATFRLTQSAGGGDLVGDWDKFLDMVHSVKNAADSIHGVPLLITKAEFITLQPNKGPQAKAFFMAAFAEDTILSQDITILSSPAFQLSNDPVESIELNVDGTTLQVDPGGNTPLRFSGKGEKTVQMTVRFASGFVGENIFRVVVDPVLTISE